MKISDSNCALPQPNPQTGTGATSQTCAADRPEGENLPSIEDPCYQRSRWFLSTESLASSLSRSFDCPTSPFRPDTTVSKSMRRIGSARLLLLVMSQEHIYQSPQIAHKTEPLLKHTRNPAASVWNDGMLSNSKKATGVVF